MNSGENPIHQPGQHVFNHQASQEFPVENMLNIGSGFSPVAACWNFHLSRSWNRLWTQVSLIAMLLWWLAFGLETFYPITKNPWSLFRWWFCVALVFVLSNRYRNSSVLLNHPNFNQSNIELAKPTNLSVLDLKERIMNENNEQVISAHNLLIWIVFYKEDLLVFLENLEFQANFLATCKWNRILAKRNCYYNSGKQLWITFF